MFYVLAFVAGASTGIIGMLFYMRKHTAKATAAVQKLDEAINKL